MAGFWRGWKATQKIPAVLNLRLPIRMSAELKQAAEQILPVAA